MGRTVSNAPGYALDDEFDPRIDDFESKDRRYLHFDLPLSESERANFEVSADDICRNSFWPLIGYVNEERRARKSDAGDLIFLKKDRPIKFGSHRDAAILEYYSKSLSIDYELFLSEHTCQDSVLAYRSGIGNNIDHAKSLSDEIRQRGSCTAIALDIKGFFDNIQHSKIYQALQLVRKSERLPLADFKVFERMTRFEWVESEDLKERLGKKYGRSGRICFPEDFRRLVRETSPSLVQQNAESFGIPQGTPLSGLYANLSMQEFDRFVFATLAEVGASYRRYSDDIAIVLPEGLEAHDVIAMVSKSLSEIGLNLSDAKTEIAHFCQAGDVQSASKPFQYLGFTFDGKKTLIRASSLNRYYTKMSRGIRSKIRAAKNQKIPHDEIFMRELLRKYTHFGRNKNFPRYAYRAAKILEAPEIRSQLRGHMGIFKTMISNAIERIY